MKQCPPTISFTKFLNAQLRYISTFEDLLNFYLFPFKLFLSCSFFPFVFCVVGYICFMQKNSTKVLTQKNKQVQNTKKKSKLGKDLKSAVSL
jgi:hypothetical protein